MMGHRGCRLAVTYPEIAKMQTKAVIRAAIEVQKAHADWNVKPEIMIPLVCEIKELKYVKKVVVETADAEIAAAGVELEYEVGTMIEIPRAALTADEIATEADFFCFGTNDLTQMTFGFSRDDAGKFLNAYYDTKIFENDPFAKLDQTGVGKLMEMAIKLGKPVNPKLHVGICGEHGGDPSSVEFCHKIGLDYVSCSPFRVPIARLYNNKQISSVFERRSFFAFILTPPLMDVSKNERHHRREKAPPARGAFLRLFYVLYSKIVSKVTGVKAFTLFSKSAFCSAVSESFTVIVILQ